MTSPDLDTVRHGYAPTGGSEPDPPAEVPLRELATTLIDDVRATIAAEQELFSARMALFGDGAKRASIWGVIAATLLFLAAMALVLGAVLVLSSRLGPELATLITTAVLLILAIGAALFARRGARDASAAFKAGTGDRPGAIDG